MSFQKITVFPDELDLMFSYGMNTNQTLMKLRCKEATVLGAGTLAGHKLHFRYHCDIVRTDDLRNQVHGLVWQIHKDDLEIIDAIEGYPEYYTRERVYVNVPRENGIRSMFGCWAYHMNNQIGVEPPDEQYLKLVMEGYEQNNLPTKQLIDALERCNMYVEMQND